MCRISIRVVLFMQLWFPAVRRYNKTMHIALFSPFMGSGFPEGLGWGTPWAWLALLGGFCLGCEGISRAVRKEDSGEGCAGRSLPALQYSLTLGTVWGLEELREEGMASGNRWWTPGTPPRSRGFPQQLGLEMFGTPAQDQGWAARRRKVAWLCSLRCRLHRKPVGIVSSSYALLPSFSPESCSVVQVKAPLLLLVWNRLLGHKIPC